MTINVDEALRKLRKPELKFDVHTDVQIIKNADKDGYRDLLGCVGTVIAWDKRFPFTLPPGTYYYEYRVKIPGRRNCHTKDGAFIFTEKYLSKLEETTEGGNKMLLKGYKIVGVKFRENDRIYYFASYEKGLKIDDVVCVHTRFGFNIAMVAAINVDAKEVQCNVTEQVVSKINTAAYDERIKQAERIQELEKVLDQKLKDAQKLAIFEMFSKNDEEFAKLLSEYKSLTENK